MSSAGAKPVVCSQTRLALWPSDTLRVGFQAESGKHGSFPEVLRDGHHELAADLARHLQLPMKAYAAHTEEELLCLLDSGVVHLLAADLCMRSEWKERFRQVFPQGEMRPVLVQRREKKMLTEAYELVGKVVHVVEHSVCHRRLVALNDELGGGIEICAVSDTLSVDRLIDMVRCRQIDYAVAPSSRASLHCRQSVRLDMSVEAGIAQPVGWLTASDASELSACVEQWRQEPQTVRLANRLRDRYARRSSHLSDKADKAARQVISPFDTLFMENARRIAWDWRLLAAMAFYESTFKPDTVSVAGASGLMQLMPRTAAIYGVDSLSIFLPEENIRAAADYLNDITKLFVRVENPDERVKFVLAGYNGGPFHIVDAMTLAERYGYDPHRWEGHVAYFLHLKKEPDFYMDTLVKYGSFNARETLRYVEDVLRQYARYTE